MVVRRIVLVLTVLALAGLALAQVVIEPPEELVLTDPTTWFLNVAALGFVVFSLTGFVKQRFDTHAWVTLGVSFGSSVALAVLATLDLPWLGQLFQGTVPEAIMFGLSAAVLASGGRDGVMQLVGAILGKR